MNGKSFGFDVSADFLHEREIEKLKKLAIACNQEYDEEFLKRAFKKLIKVIPNSVKERHFVDKEIQSLIQNVSRDGDFVVVTLENGYSLKTFSSRQQYRNYYYCFHDLLPKLLHP